MLETNDAYRQSDQMSVSTRVSAFVDTVHVTDNQSVTAGQPLFHFGPTDPGPQLIVPQFLRGAAQFFTLFFLNQAATAAVAQNLVEDASGLFNAARNPGGSFGLAAIATLQDQRMALHTARLEESISANSVIGHTAARTQSLSQIYEAIQTQALVMTYSDLYFLLGVAMFVLIPVAFLLKPLPKTQKPSPK